MSDTTARLVAAASAIEGRIDAAVALMGQLAGIIRELKDDPAELEALAARLEGQAYELGQAIETYNPDAQPPAEEPPVGEETEPGAETETGTDTLSGSDSLSGADVITEGDAPATLTDFAAADAASSGNDSTQG